MPGIQLAVPAGAAAVLLVVYALGVARGLTATPREHDPQGGQAAGCLTIMLIGLLGLGAVLAAGVYWRVPWLVWAVFGAAVCPLVGLARGAAVRAARARRGRG
jgi:hypothetical protein